MITAGVPDGGAFAPSRSAGVTALKENEELRREVREEWGPPRAFLREVAERSQADFTALIGLIEAAPVPMWFRDPDMRLRLVNQAYVEAHGANDGIDFYFNHHPLLSQPCFNA